MTGRTAPSARRRVAPLHAGAALEIDAVAESPTQSPAAAEAQTAAPGAPSARDRRFIEKVRALRVGTTSVKLEEHLLMVIGGVLAPLGLVVVLLGWWGAAHSPYLFEQLPYVISGGLFGLGLIFLGSFLYFTHWITQLVKEHRTQSAALLDAIQRVEARLERDAAPVGATSSNGVASDMVLVATGRGTMAHRPDCVVVVGKSGLRQVSESDGLAVCKLCSA